MTHEQTAASPPSQLSDPSCIFCRIIGGEIPCHRVYEDDCVLALLDIGPVVAGHVLVIPKSHYKNIFDIPAQVIAEVSARLPRLARAVTAATGSPACHILINNGAEAMQSVFHLHYHIIPRQDGDTFFVPWKTTRLDPRKAESLIDAIGAAMQNETQSVLQ